MTGLSPSAACANMRSGIPGSEDRFSVERSPHQQELAKLMPILDASHVPDDVRQAAVWIVTDNADYDDLGILVTGFVGFGTRAIHESETVRAMQICDRAGIDITQKAIWGDKEQILRGLKDDDPLKTWLDQKK